MHVVNHRHSATHIQLPQRSARALTCDIPLKRNLNGTDKRRKKEKTERKQQWNKTRKHKKPMVSTVSVSNPNHNGHWITYWYISHAHVHESMKHTLLFFIAKLLSTAGQRVLWRIKISQSINLLLSIQIIMLGDSPFTFWSHRYLCT